MNEPARAPGELQCEVWRPDGMHIILEAIVWGLLWEFPITCLLALLLAVLGAGFWGVWGAVVGGAAGLALGTVLDMADNGLGTR